MRALTVRQPWATSIVRYGKDVENRSRNIAGAYRGPVAIHAGLEEDRSAWSASLLLKALSTLDAVSSTLNSPPPRQLVRGAILGVVDLVDVHHAEVCWDRDIQRLARLQEESPAEFDALPDDGAGGLIGRAQLCSMWAQLGAWHLVLANPRPLANPIPYRGRLGLWTLPDGVLPGEP
jgi:hypothetical protein